MTTPTLTVPTRWLQISRHDAGAAGKRVTFDRFVAKYGHIFSKEQARIAASKLGQKRLKKAAMVTAGAAAPAMVYQNEKPAQTRHDETSAGQLIELDNISIKARLRRSSGYRQPIKLIDS